ncbi:TenA family transcriptional regulator [Kineococcus radiotolerans]|uniref:Transcriptional activator, TenA family n=1 Tax=Kineococcus radiotolerans (strain ATCC BAA-149 / DSM 14245 / SRS30216) TaxID=266940 RepID=A6W6A4_KINRD|nr:TenA family transcriptional regulator [Kineococcus radiotolerans]ABS02343.1 transcriptional activator, TenA family [Kineococcus radiotolerans SRS30216 = ATCC BAA-149]
MSFTDDTWARTAALRSAIEGSAFLAELGAGTLDPATFRHYLEQDTIYLAGYARALALLAARAPGPAAAGFWAGSAGNAAAVEVALHADLLTGGLLPEATGPATASPTTLGYVSYLVAAAATAPYPVAAAAVLPCYWIYADAGRRLAAHAELVAEHPYARWVAAYDAPEFHASVATARRLVDEAAEANPGDVEAMHDAFALATRYEWLFWETAHARESWPAPA